MMYTYSMVSLIEGPETPFKLDDFSKTRLSQGNEEMRRHEWGNENGNKVKALSHTKPQHNWYVRRESVHSDSDSNSSDCDEDFDCVHFITFRKAIFGVRWQRSSFILNLKRIINF